MGITSVARIATPVLASAVLASTSLTASAQTPPPAEASSSVAKTCSSKGLPGRVQVLRGQSAASTRVARAIFAQAVRCDSASLVKRATKDKTFLSYGGDTPAQYFALPDPEHRYAALVRAMSSTKPAYEKHSRSYVWPRVAVGGKANDTAAAWWEVVRAGLLTQRQADAMRRAGSGYMGYRVAVTDRGRWVYFVAGD